MKKNIVIIFFLVFLFTPLWSEESNTPGSVNAYIEVDQILSVKYGIEYSFNSTWGIKGAAGMSPPGIKVFTYNLMGIYHFNFAWKRWQLDFEFGMPLAYFDQLEDRYVDWDPIIDSPYAGWLFGVNFLISYKTTNNNFGLRLGIAEWWEHQTDSGWKGPRIMPIVAFVWDF